MELEKQMKQMFGKQMGHREDFFFFFLAVLSSSSSSSSRWSSCSGFSLVAVSGSYSLIAVQGLTVTASHHGAQSPGHTDFSSRITWAQLLQLPGSRAQAQ